MEAGGNDLHGDFWDDVIFMAQNRPRDYVEVKRGKIRWNGGM